MGVAQETAEGFFGLPPRRVAVAMVDFQNDFCSPEVVSNGPVTNTGNAETAQRANAFAGHAAGLGAQVVYTQQVLDMDRLTARQRRWERPGGLCAAGTWGSDLFVVPVAGSSVVVKYRFDCWQSPSPCCRSGWLGCLRTPGCWCRAGRLIRAVAFGRLRLGSSPGRTALLT